MLFLIFAMFFIIYSIKVVYRISKLQEIRSDEDAGLKTKNPKSMQSALLKYNYELFKETKRPSFFENILKYLHLYSFGTTHPNLKERLENLELTNKILVDGGNIRN